MKLDRIGLNKPQNTTMYWQKFISRNWQKKKLEHDVCYMANFATRKRKNHTRNHTVYKLKHRFGSWNNIIYHISPHVKRKYFTLVLTKHYI